MEGYVIFLTWYYSKNIFNIIVIVIIKLPSHAWK